MSVIFFVALVAAFDLSRLRNRFQLAPKLRLVFATNHITTARDFCLHPFVIFAVGFDLQFAPKRVCMQARRGRACATANPEINQSALQMRAVNPLRNARVRSIRHQQRQAKIAQQSLGRARPVALVVAHRNQLASEGQIRLREIQRRTQRTSQLDLRALDIATSLPQALHFIAQQPMPFARFGQFDAQFGVLILQRGFAGFRSLKRRSQRLLMRIELRSIMSRRPAEGVRIAAVALGLVGALRLFQFLAVNIGVDERDTITTIFGNRATQRLFAFAPT